MYLVTINASNKMFALLLSAQGKNQPVLLGISDDVSLTAYPGRCSVKVVSLLEKIE